MKTLTTSFAGLAAIVLASLPVAALSTAAHAQTGSSHERIYVGDLNLATASGKAAFETRVDHVARRFCSTEKNLELQAACHTGVTAEANERAAAKVQFASRI
jgi:UrcA family protein